MIKEASNEDKTDDRRSERDDKSHSRVKERGGLKGNFRMWVKRVVRDNLIL
jgi:hypothetical protein